MRDLSGGLQVGTWLRTVRVAPPAAVAPGQSVEADTPLGSTIIPGRLHVIDIAARLGLAPAAIGEALLVSTGEAVQIGQALAAQRVGWRRRTVAAPCTGTVQSLTEGCLLLRAEPHTQTVAAGLAGRVETISSDGEITLLIGGTRITCTWAAGHEVSAPLVIASAHDEELRWQHVGRHLHGTILVGGRLTDERVFGRARQFGLAGLLVGSIAADLALHTEPPVTVLATEGLGEAPMSSTIHEALASLAGRTALLAPGDADGAFAAICHPLATTDDEQPGGLGVGSRVRLTRAPYLGQSGQIVDTPAGARRTALGTLAEGALVALDSGQRVFVPWTNLERLA